MCEFGNPFVYIHPLKKGSLTWVHGHHVGATMEITLELEKKWIIEVIQWELTPIKPKPMI